MVVVMLISLSFYLAFVKRFVKMVCKKKMCIRA